MTGDDRALAAVSFRRIEQRSTLSVASLRRIAVDDGGASAHLRAVIASLGLVAHAGAFGRSFSLRSECDLRVANQQWTWLGAANDSEVEPLSVDAAARLFAETVAAAEAAGLPVGSRWAAPIALTPNLELAKVIRATYPALD